jgi:hypothetical protein
MSFCHQLDLKVSLFRRDKVISNHRSRANLQADWNLQEYGPKGKVTRLQDLVGYNHIILSIHVLDSKNHLLL